MVHPDSNDTASPAPDEEVVGAEPAAPDATPARRRPKPGERRVQILQTLAHMLEQPGAERITTAGLAAKLDVSEAALYRHFASKAQMFEGLIEFIESSVFTLVNQVQQRETDARTQARTMLTVLLQFAEKNPGMSRVMAGDALVFEHDRLITRMNQFFDRFESQLRQALKSAGDAAGAAAPTADAQSRASVVTCFALGRIQRFARSGFKRVPTEHLDAALAQLI